VRVLNCQGSGSYSKVIAGIDWVAANHRKPAVANMSLGGGYSRALETAIANAVKKGVTFAVAAGNDNADACKGSPAHSPAAIRVGSTTNFDERSNFQILVLVWIYLLPEVIYNQRGMIRIVEPIQSVEHRWRPLT
jgi:subtilisin family serine protease